VAASRIARAGEREAVAGTLQLGVTALKAGYVMSGPLARFRRANPEVTVGAIEDSGEYIEHLLIGASSMRR
jgi:DNA-binding transcriptional LysR family regulator